MVSKQKIEFKTDQLKSTKIDSFTLIRTKNVNTFNNIIHLIIHLY